VKWIHIAQLRSYQWDGPERDDWYGGTHHIPPEVLEEAERICGCTGVDFLALGKQAGGTVGWGFFNNLFPH
jgi:hypothetical protein